MNDLAATPPPGPILRDPAYQDLCRFFGGFEEGKEWRPQFGDWVVTPPSTEPLLVVRYEAEGEQIVLWGGPGTEQDSQPRSSCVWLPTLDQLRILVRSAFGTTGFFSSNFNNTTYWFTGQLLGMTVTNMQPLAEGSSPEEAALKALLMRHQW